MRNTWLILRREYMERIRSRAFIILTFLTPLFIFAVVVLPTKLLSMKSAGTHRILVISDNEQFGAEVKKELVARRAVAETNSDDPANSAPRYEVTVSSRDDQPSREKLNSKVVSGSIDGYLWLDNQGISTHEFTYVTRHSSDFIDNETVRNATETALTKLQLDQAGVSAEIQRQVLRGVRLNTLRVSEGKTSKAGGAGAILAPILMMMMIYMSLIIYGMAVMRSTIEEKQSRVIEVLLSSIHARDLMMGKVFGVGAVGLTQMLIWTVMGMVVGSPGLIAAKDLLAQLNFSLPVLLGMPVFFLFGYLLYSSLYAAVGAMVNSEEEAQQMQWPVLIPLIACTAVSMNVVRQPDSAMSFWLSMFPFTSPIVMFVRMVVQMPPLWQVFLSMAILATTIWGVLLVCARIYRVGILMYGKRPTLPEILKWIRYA